MDRQIDTLRGFDWRLNSMGQVVFPWLEAKHRKRVRLRLEGIKYGSVQEI
jgi:hypothetical protein